MRNLEFIIDHVTGQGETAPCFISVTVLLPLWGPIKKKVAYLSGAHRAPRGVFLHSAGTIGVIKSHPSELEKDWLGDWHADHKLEISKFIAPGKYEELDRFLALVAESKKLYDQKLIETENARAKEERAETALNQGRVSYLSISKAGGLEALEKLTAECNVELHVNDAVMEDARFVARRIDELPAPLKKFALTRYELRFWDGSPYTDSLDDLKPTVEKSQPKIESETHDLHQKYKLWTDTLLAVGTMPAEVPELHRPVVTAMARARIAEIEKNLKNYESP